MRSSFKLRRPKLLKRGVPLVVWSGCMITLAGEGHGTQPLRALSDCLA